MNQKKSINPPINPGISLLVVVFLVLCLFTFSAITLTTSINEHERSLSSANNTKAYYTATNKAEHDINDIVKDVKSKGLWTIEKTIELKYEMNDTQELQIVLEPLDSPNDNACYLVSKWQVVNISTWEPDDTMNLFVP